MDVHVHYDVAQGYELQSCKTQGCQNVCLADFFMTFFARFFFHRRCGALITISPGCQTLYLPQLLCMPHGATKTASIGRTPTQCKWGRCLVNVRFGPILVESHQSPHGIHNPSISKNRLPQEFKKATSFPKGYAYN